MKGSDGLNVGDLIYLVPDVGDPDDDPSEYDTRAVIVSLPEGLAEPLGYVRLCSWLWPAKESRNTYGVAVTAYFLVADTEWYRSQAEANEAAAASEEEYGRRCLEFARRAREGRADVPVTHKADSSLGLATLCGVAGDDRNLHVTAIARHVTCPRCLERLAGR